MADEDPQFQVTRPENWDALKMGAMGLLGPAAPFAAPLFVPKGMKALATNPFVRSFVKSASAGVSEPAAAAISSVAEKPFQWMGKLPERSIAEAYKDYRGSQQAETDRLEEESPGMSKIGDLAGVVAPGGVYGHAWNLAGKAVSPILKGGAALAKTGLGGRIAEKALKYAVALPLKGALANTAYQGVNPESRIYNDPEFAAGNAAMGAIAAPVGEAVSNTIASAAGSRPVQAGTRAIGRWLKRKTPGANEYGEILTEDAQKAFEGGKEALGAKIGTNSPEEVAAGFQKATKGAQRGLSKQWRKVMTPLMEEHGGKPAAVESVKRRIGTYLKQYGALDAKGNINREAFPFALDSPEGKVLEDLARKMDLLNRRPTIEGLDAFQRAVRLQADNSQNPAIARIYNGIYDSSKRALIDSVRRSAAETNTAGIMRGASKEIRQAKGVSKFAGKELGKPFVGGRVAKEMADMQASADLKVAQIGKDAAAQGEREAIPTAKAVRDVRKLYATKKPVIARAEKISNAEDAEKVLQMARSKTQGLTGSYIRRAMQHTPEMRAPIQKVVMMDLLSKAQTPKGLTKAMNSYGADRAAIKELFGDEVFNTLAALEKSLERGTLKTGGVMSKAGKYAIRAPAALGKYLPPILGTQAQDLREGDDAQ